MIELSEDGRYYVIRIPRKEFERADPEGAPLLPSLALTRRQEVILELLRVGKNNKEIAADLGIAVRTVKFHISGLLAAFGVRDRHELLKGKRNR